MKQRERKTGRLDREACRPAELVRQVCRIIEEHDSGRPLTLAALAAQVRVSRHHLQKTFRRVMGITPRQYFEACRVSRLKALCREGRNVTSALYDAGYGSSSRLYEQSLSRFGMTPGTYRRGGQGMKIGYAIAESPLGRLLVAATGNGICAVSLGESDSDLIQALAREYPAAEIREDGSGLGEWVEALLKYLGGWQPHLDLPLDLRVTAFQQRVYQELRAIPYGETRTYQEVAAALGQPGAVRAVARACAANPAALLVPCHRVLRKDGRPGGYRWGLERKARLLALESEGREGNGMKGTGPVEQ
ncbi:MAG: methylated-DNA--[protein]-cysteine S-methyltransferase [Syntrophomonadaceae bacterium]|nr:methylated-DNA--[protein]-cysteine S-methyltransferase [Syntrophomonadaceae bacterium]